ncbi:MAG: helix-turn-helix transcriptional regulator [Eubacteriales bacterium]
MNISEKFISLRKSKDYSIYKLSRVSDISENYIRNIEKGSSQPSVFILEKLLLALGTTVSEFFNESEEVIYPTPFEKDLVESVRMLNEEEATALLNMVKLLRK